MDNDRLSRTFYFEQKNIFYARFSKSVNFDSQTDCVLIGIVLWNIAQYYRKLYQSHKFVFHVAIAYHYIVSTKCSKRSKTSLTCGFSILSYSVLFMFMSVKIMIFSPQTCFLTNFETLIWFIKRMPRNWDDWSKTIFQQGL